MLGENSPEKYLLSCNELLNKYFWELKDSKANQDEKNVQKQEIHLAATKGIQRGNVITRKSKRVILDKKCNLASMPRNKENESSIPIHIRTNIKSIKKKALKRNQYPDGTKEKVKKDKVIK